MNLTNRLFYGVLFSMLSAFVILMVVNKFYENTAEQEVLRNQVLSLRSQIYRERRQLQEIFSKQVARTAQAEDMRHFLESEMEIVLSYIEEQNVDLKDFALGHSVAQRYLLELNNISPTGNFQIDPAGSLVSYEGHLLLVSPTTILFTNNMGRVSSRQGFKIEVKKTPRQLAAEAQ